MHAYWRTWVPVLGELWGGIALIEFVFGSSRGALASKFSSHRRPPDGKGCYAVTPQFARATPALPLEHVRCAALL